MAYKTSMFEALLSSGSNRSDAITDEVRGLTIDTCYARDTGEWETGVKRNGEWIIVEHYGNDKDAAEKGHEKWCQIVSDDPEDDRIQQCDDFVPGF